MRGVDANQSLASRAQCIAREGITFVCRYLKEGRRALTQEEARTLSAAGLYVVAIVERGYPTSGAYFSAARGRDDGAFALRRALEAGVPHGAPLYFAVDYDASESEVNGPISSYFHEANQALGGRHPLGVYGSGLVCRHLLTATPVTFSWLAMSTGWRESHTFTGWNIKQTGGGMMCGIQVDFNQSNGHGGGFRV